MPPAPSPSGPPPLEGGPPPLEEAPAPAPPGKRGGRATERALCILPCAAAISLPAMAAARWKMGTRPTVAMLDALQA